MCQYDTDDSTQGPSSPTHRHFAKNEVEKGEVGQGGGGGGGGGGTGVKGAGDGGRESQGRGKREWG